MQTVFDVVMSNIPAEGVLRKEEHWKLWSPIVNRSLESLDKKRQKFKNFLIPVRKGAVIGVLGRL